MNYHSSTVAEVLQRLNREVFIPGIQRPFVWEPEQVVRLFDSLMRRYPINSFLFWHLEPRSFADWDIFKFVHRFRHGDIHNERAAIIDDKAVTLVLDGQQRLTSMLIGLDGSYTTRLKNARRAKDSSWVENVLYLDLLQLPDEDPAEEDDTAVRDLHYGFRFASSESPPRDSQDHDWFRVSEIMRARNREMLDELIDERQATRADLSSGAHRAIRTTLTRLWEAVWQHDCISFYLEKDQSYDKVLDIFIRANDGGTKLSKSDLLMSMVTLRWDLVHAREATTELTYALRETLEQQNGFDRDYLLRAGLFFNDLNFGFQIRNFTPRNISIIENSWEALDKALRDSASLFSRWGVVGPHLTASNIVMLVACYVFKLNKGLPREEWSLSPDDEEQIRRWVLAALFHGVLGGTANVTMELYRKVLNEQLLAAPAFPSKALVQRMTRRGRVMEFDSHAVDRLCELDARGRLARPSLSLAYERNVASDGRGTVEPIFPKHYLSPERLRGAGLSDDEIAKCLAWESCLVNMALMSSSQVEEHRRLDFDDWWQSRTPEFLAEHLIPNDPALFEPARFPEFVAARKALMKAALGRLFEHVKAIERLEIAGQAGALATDRVSVVPMTAGAAADD